MEYVDKILAYGPNVAILSALALVIFIAHKSKDSTFSAFDYLLDPATGKASITKTLQVIGGLTATWIVIKLAAIGTLSVEMFSVYLAALGISEAWSKFIGAKYSQSSSSQNLNG